MKWPIVIYSVKISVDLSSALLDENSRQDKCYEITNVNKGNNYKVNVGPH